MNEGSLYDRLLFNGWFRWLVKRITGEVPMLSVTLTNVEAISLVRKRCKAFSRKAPKCPYEIGNKIVARVETEGQLLPYAELTIKTIRPMKMSEMTLEMAKAEGFSSVEGWRVHFSGLYGATSVAPDATFFRVGFDVEKMLTEKLKEDSYDARKRAADTVNP